MIIGGLQKVSLIDFPGLICASIFSQGCNFQCPYCHNPELVAPSLFQNIIRESDVLAFLQERRGKLDAVTITGGEPTLQSDILLFVKKIKIMGFAVKLDTNGSRPEVIKTLLDEKLLDFIAMDIKGPLEKYADITRVQFDVETIKESVNIILQSGIPHEFRTTIVKSLLTEKDISKIARIIEGARSYALQRFVPAKTLNKNFQKETNYTDNVLNKIKKRLEKEISSVIVR